MILRIIAEAERIFSAGRSGTKATTQDLVDVFATKCSMFSIKYLKTQRFGAKEMAVIVESTVPFFRIMLLTSFATVKSGW